MTLVAMRGILLSYRFSTKLMSSLLIEIRDAVHSDKFRLLPEPELHGRFSPAWVSLYDGGYVGADGDVEERRIAV